MTCDARSCWPANAVGSLPTAVTRLCVLVWTGLVLACFAAPDHGQTDMASTGSEEVPTPPGWPLEVGDTMETGTVHALVARFKPMGWADATDLVLNREEYEAIIQKSQYGIAAFDYTYIEVPRDYKGWRYACPPDGFVLEQQEPEDYWTLDGALIVNLPPEIPCDPEKRYVGGRIYVGQVR